MNRPLYRPDYDRRKCAYLTHRRATHYDKMLNFDQRIFGTTRSESSTAGLRGDGATARARQEMIVGANTPWTKENSD
jgi:hypothetical protein